MAFSGADYSNPDKFLKYREQIWTYLEDMISKDGLKTVPQVGPELEFNDFDSWQRLFPLRGKFILPTDGDADRLVLDLIYKYGRKFAFSGSSSYTRTPADPFLIVYAKKLGVQIITDELPLAKRKGKSKDKKLTIADVCDGEGMSGQYICLEDFLKGEGIIPKDYTP